MSLRSILWKISPRSTLSLAIKRDVHVKIVNESGKDYYYVDKSLQVEVPAQNLDEPRETVYRPNNQALIALGLDEYASSRDWLTQLSDLY